LLALTRAGAIVLIFRIAIALLAWDPVFYLLETLMEDAREPQGDP